MLPSFEKIYILSESLNSPLAQRVRSLYPPELIQIADHEPFQNQNQSMTAKQFDRSKKILTIKRFKGEFFKRCPGATQKKTLTCCNYHVLNLGSQCNMNCSYCYLQSYLTQPTTVLYSNIDQALNELKEMADKFSQLPFRVGTGEITDSLSLDLISLYSVQLIEFFKMYPKWTLEFKTKSALVDQFLNLEHAGNVTVSWSINPQFVISSEEHGTASFVERIAAAKKCVEKGFPIAFHIDPMIYHSNWKENYLDLVNQICLNFTADQVQVISVGALRFQPEQRHIMKERFGMGSLITQAEMFQGEGAKLRYDQNLRQEMFQTVVHQFKSNNPKWKIFMCMETPETWISTYGSNPMQVPELKELFRPLPKI